MSIPALSLLFPIILAIHNAEEYARYDEFIRIYYGKLAVRFVARPAVRNAIILLTLTAAVISFLTWIHRNQALMEISVVASFALMLNAVSHILVSFRRHSLTPGTFSAIALVLPYSAAVVATLRLTQGMPWLTILRFAVLGLITAPVAIALFLFLGYSLSCLTNLRVTQLPASHCNSTSKRPENSTDP